MTPESKQFLAYVASQPKGRVAFEPIRFDAARALAEESLEHGYAVFRRLGRRPGFQITEAGKVYLGGEA